MQSKKKYYRIIKNRKPCCLSIYIKPSVVDELIFKINTDTELNKVLQIIINFVSEISEFLSNLLIFVLNERFLRKIHYIH